MAELMGDPRDPDAHDGAPAAVDDAPDLVLETAPVDTSVAIGVDAAAVREAVAHLTKAKFPFTVTRESQVSRAAFTFTVNHM